MMMALSYLWPPEAKVKSYTAFERKKKKKYSSRSNSRSTFQTLIVTTKGNPVGFVSYLASHPDQQHFTSVNYTVQM